MARFLPPDGAGDARGPAREELSQARARRVERADLVRDVMNRKRREDGDDSHGPVDQPAEPIVLEPQPAPDPPREQPRRQEVAPAANAPIDAAVPPALEVLGRWWHDDQRRADEQAARLEAEPNPRRRAKLDDRGDLERALDAAGGATFLRELIDDVLRPDDLLASGFGLHDLADRIPDTLTPATRRRFRLGAFAGPGIPFIAVPAVRRATRGFFGTAVTEAGPEPLTKSIDAVREAGAEARVRPLTDPVLGDRGAEAARARVRTLLAHPHVAEVELDWNTLEPRPCDWDFSGTAERAAGQLAGLLAVAREQPHRPVLMLRATNSRNVELAVDTMIRALGSDLGRGARAGVSLPVDLPDSATLLRRLAGAAHLLREEGAAPLKVGLHRMSDRLRERADALRNGWKVAAYLTDDDVDANMVRLIDAVLAPEHRGVLELELDSTVPFDAAIAAALAPVRQSLTRVVVVVNQGTDERTLARLRELGVEPRQRIAQLPDGAGWRPAASYLRGIVTDAARRHLEAQEPTSADGLGPQQERLLSAIARMQQIPAGQLRRQERIAPEDAPGVTAAIKLELFPEGLFEDEPEPEHLAVRRYETGELLTDDLEALTAETTVLGDRSRLADLTAADREGADDDRDATETGVVTADDEAALANPAETGATPNLTEVVLGLRGGRILRNTFRNDPLSDATLAGVRDWANHIQHRAQRSELGIDEAAEHQLHTTEQVQELLDRAHAAGDSWRQTSGWERAAKLEQIAKALDANRARLIEVAMAETGLAFDEIDRDVSHAIDLANYDAHLARQLDRMQGAEFVPVAVSVGVPGWIMPVTSIVSIVVAALAAGSAMILKPSPRTERTAAIVARVIWATELADGLLQVAGNDYTQLTDEQLGRELIVDPRVERVLMQGTYATASHFLEWRPELPLIGASGGKSSVIVTAAADYDLAAREIARSVVDAAGQNPLRPSTAILVGPAALRSRFAEQLADAVASTRVGYPSDPSVHAGPLVTKATGKAYEMLTHLGEGERWLVEPRRLDDTGRLWTPGVRAGVKTGSPILTNDAAVPVINIVHVDTLDTAIELQNSLDYGLGAGLFSLDRTEIAHWVQQVEAGNLFVNRDVIDNRVQRQPYGGWKRSMIGTKLKSGGPNTLLHLGSWRPAEPAQSHTLHLRGLEESTARLIEALQPGLAFEEFERVRRTALSCQIAWNEEYGEVVDVTNLPIERNLLRYRPAPCLIRASSDATTLELAQVLVAASAARAKIRVSTANELSPGLLRELQGRGAEVRVESDEEFLERMRTEGLLEAPRLRLLGGSRSELFANLSNSVDIAVFSDHVTLAGRLEMLPFLREQAISITAHRFGYQDGRVQNLFPHELVVDHAASLFSGDARLHRPQVDD
jgi:RHH-type proline utilization regulon transcriptional repressor/proline dehydrogenase/delta 1-pyrroline-5-carboxylate dehydrogenase